MVTHQEKACRRTWICSSWKQLAWQFDCERFRAQAATATPASWHRSAPPWRGSFSVLAMTWRGSGRRSPATWARRRSPTNRAAACCPRASWSAASRPSEPCMCSVCRRFPWIWLSSRPALGSLLLRISRTMAAKTPPISTTATRQSTSTMSRPHLAPASWSENTRIRTETNLRITYFWLLPSPAEVWPATLTSRLDALWAADEKGNASSALSYCCVYLFSTANNFKWSLELTKSNINFVFFFLLFLVHTMEQPLRPPTRILRPSKRRLLAIYLCCFDTKNLLWYWYLKTLILIISNWSNSLWYWNR